MRTASSFARRIGSALAVAAAAALAAASVPARAEGGGGKAEPTSATCRICHTDPVFGAAFSHRGLEESADGCMTCHPGPGAHVKARGGRGSIPIPTGQETCLACHEESSAPKHLAPMGKDAACGACHVLHGGAPPVRAKAVVRSAPPPPAPARGRLSGRIEAGWRFVGEEEGRYDQDVGLDDGPRLFGLDLRAGSDDPLAPRAEASLEGLGDPHASARVRARHGDRWKATLDGRRDELPFLGQNGLHGGESLRESLSAGLDLGLSPTARLGLGYDLRNHEGEIRGTTLETGVVLPVAVRQDRRTQEGSITLDLRGEAWFAKVRQAWLDEEGTDGRRREASTAAVPDRLSVDDDSTMDGPLTSVAIGADALEGVLSVEARASRADLDREVDVAESRRADLAGPYARRSTVTGSRDRVVESQALEAALGFGDRWALEASFDRRTLKEDGRVEERTTTTTSAGTTVATASADDRVSQRVTEERVGVRRAVGKDFHLRAGAEWIQDRLDYLDDAEGGKTRSRGFYVGAAGAVTPEVRFRGEARTARGSGTFTPLTPTESRTLALGASYRDEEGTRGGVDWTLAAMESGTGDTGSRGWDFRAWGGLGKDDGVVLDVGWTVRNRSLDVDNLSYIGSTLAPGESLSLVRSHVLDFALGVPLSPTLRLTVGGSWVLDRGTLPLRAFDAKVALRWRISPTFAARLEYRRREYDEMGSDALDYEADVLEVSVETCF